MLSRAAPGAEGWELGHKAEHRVMCGPGFQRGGSLPAAGVGVGVLLLVLRERMGARDFRFGMKWLPII